MERIFNKDAVELSAKERNERNKISRIGIIAGLVLFLALAVIYISVKLY